MLTIELARTLAVAPAAAWQLCAHPDAMNRWSTARIASRALGDGGHPGGVGALRTVVLPRRAGRLLEVIERATPGEALEYRVIAGAPVRSHRGVLTFAAASHGCDLRWRVDVEPATRALGPVIRRLLVPELERSLDRLVAIAPSVTGVLATALPAARAIDRDVDVARLARDAKATAAAQGDLADELLAGGDPRGHFARVYQYVTEGQVDLVERAAFDHPAWVLRLIPVFDRYFTDNLSSRVREPHWARAFAHVARTAERTRDPFERMVHAVWAGMRAHIEGDLPRTLAHVYRAYYARQCDPARFRADYLRMPEVFTRAGERISADIPRTRWPLRARLVDYLTPSLLRDRIIDRYVYPITKQRARAFERAAQLW